MVFTLLSGRGKISKKRGIIPWDTRKVHEIQTSVSISNIFLEHSHNPAFTYCLWRLWGCRAKSNIWLQSLKHLLSDPLQKELADPSLKGVGLQSPAPLCCLPRTYPSGKVPEVEGQMRGDPPPFPPLLPTCPSLTFKREGGLSPAPGA